MTAWLTEEDMRLLTGYTRHGWQRKALARMGIEFRTRLDGYPLVERAAVIQYQNSTFPDKQRRREPRFPAVN